jgi:hypothetical protein
MSRGAKALRSRTPWWKQGALRWWLLGVAAVAATAVVASLLLVPDRTDGRTVRATVGADGFSLELAGIRVVAPAGVAPSGTTVTARLLEDDPAESPLPRAADAGPGIDVDLDGRQPEQPVTIVFPTEHQYAQPAGETFAEDDLLPLVLTQPSGSDDVHVEPAVYDAGARTLTVTVDHLTNFWEWPGKAKDFAAEVIASVITGETAQPTCDAQPVAEGSGRQVHLDMPTPRVAWGCIELAGRDVRLTLTNTVPPPLKAQSSRNGSREKQGTLSPTEAVTMALAEKMPDYDQRSALLTQRGKVVYRYPLTSLPANLTLTADPGAYLLGALATLLQTAAELFDVDIVTDLHKRADDMECLAGAWATASGELNAHTIGTGLTAVVNCARPVIEGLGVDPSKKLMIVSVLVAAVPLVAAGLGGAWITAGGPSTVTIRRGPPVADPCSGSSSLREIVDHAMPGTIDSAVIADIELLGCVEGHIVGRLIPVYETDSSFAVLVPSGSTWDGEVLPIGTECGSTGYPRPVEVLIDCSEVPELPTDYRSLDDLCRGTTGPQADAACTARNELTRQSADENMAALLAAWSARDRGALVELTAPEAQGWVPDTILGWHLREDVPPDCEYDFRNGTHQCAVEVTEGDWGAAIRMEHVDDLLWLATFAGPIDVG